MHSALRGLFAPNFDEFQRFPWRIDDETECYSIKDLLTMQLPDIPNSASAKRSYDMEVVATIGAYDRSGQDRVTKWILETQELVG